MKKHPSIPTLVAYADEELRSDEAANVHAHVSSCAECSGVVADHRRVAAWLAEGGSAPFAAPRRDGWPAIAVELHRADRRRLIGRTAFAAAAAVVVLALGLRSRETKAPPGNILTMAGATAELERAVTAGRFRLDSATDIAVGSLLATFDVAIRQTRSALSADPDNQFLADYLAGLERKRLEALRTVVDMIRARTA
jgi:anti-sigma factor RsiW